MANILQHKRGTTAKRLAYTPADGEFILDLTTKQLFVGNGSTAGGVPVEANDSSKLPLEGGTLTGQLTVPAIANSWIAGTAGNSPVKLTPSNASSWYPWISQRTNGGNGWAVGQLGENWYLSWAAKANIDAGTNTTTQVITASSNGSVSIPGSVTASSFVGNASSATKLAAPRSIAISGAVTGTATNFDGSGNISIPTTSVDATKLSGIIPNASVSGIYDGISIRLGNANAVYTQNVGSRTSGTLVSEYRYNGSITGAIVFVTAHAPTSTMKAIRVKGYNYTSTTNIVDTLFTGYTYSASTVANSSKVDFGTLSVPARFATNADGKLCIVLGDVNTVWSYPHICIAEAYFSHTLASSDVFLNWSSLVTTDLSTYTVVSPFITNTPSGDAVTATKLQTARTIGGVAFDGSANINLPGVNTTGNQSTTGNAATATKLATARTINGVAFDGTSNITIADATKLPLTGGTINGSLNVTGGLGVSSFSSTTAYSFLNGSAAQSINIGGLLVSNSYSDASRVPVNGAYIKGQVEATGGFLGDLTGNASSATTAGKADSITAIDDRDIKPNIATVKALGTYFTSLGGMTGAANTVYGDLLVLNNYSDSSGGKVNGLFFHKGSQKILHYQAAIADTTWGTPLEIAYVTDNVASATKLATARTINGVAFDGTANITVVDSTKAPLASPALTGVPTAPTAATTTNTTQLATTAFVQAVNSADTGSSSTALTLKTARTFTYTGDVTGSVSFNGSANVSTAMTLANSGVTAGTYKSVTVDAKGRVTAGANVVTSLVTSTSATGTTNAATTNTNTFLNIVEKVGTANASPGTSTQVTGAGTVTVSSDTAGKLTITGAQSITGNAATATKLATARTINGVAFDGSANIDIGLNSGIFIGSILWFNGSRANIPDGWAAADGQVVNRTTYPDLWASVLSGVYAKIDDVNWQTYAKYRAMYSLGNGNTTFRFPDLNGVVAGSYKGTFLRGDGNGTIAGNFVNPGEMQEDAIRNITGEVGNFRGDNLGYQAATGAFASARPGTSWNGSLNVAGTVMSFDASRVVPTADENRPVSAVGVWIIRVSGATSPMPASGSPATLFANTFNGSQSILGNLTVSGSINFGSISGFDSSLNENGYQKLPNGYIEQWGYIPRGSSGIVNITFPITFPNKCLNVLTQLRHTTQNYQSTTVNTPTTTGFQMYWDNGATGIYWMARGY